MASVGKDRNGRKRILFVAEDGSRKTIRLGKASMKQALSFKVKFEALIAARITGSMDDKTATWIVDLKDDIHEKLAAVGLVDPRKSKLLGPFLYDYLLGRTDIKPATRVNLETSQGTRSECFGQEQHMR